MLGQKKISTRLLLATSALSLFGFFGVSALSFSPALASSHCPSTGYEEVNGVCFPNTTGLSNKPIDGILKNVMNWLLAILGFVAVMGFAISGIQYLTAAGDEKMIGTAKNNMKYSIIGVIVALSGFIVIAAIDNLLKGQRF